MVLELMKRVTLPTTLVVAFLLASTLVDGAPPDFLSSKCGSCHDEAAPGGLDLNKALEHYAPSEPIWEKVERVIRLKRMPPSGEASLTRGQQQEVADWFDREFVRPGGQQWPGRVLPRRLTREELQNSLEDLLYLPLRVELTNSRLHVIPDTLIEKFFPAGIIGPSGFSNDAETLAKESVDVQSYARCFKLILAMLDRNESARRKLFLGSSSTEFDRARVEQVLRRFVARAFRRPVNDREVEGYLQAFDRLAEDGDTYQALKSTMLSVLLSPSFLFRLEESSTDSKPVLVSDQDLAVRLSYFLWSAPPDEQLLGLAEAGKLQTEEVLRDQVRRMLANPKRIALAENLGGEWFDYKGLRQQSAVNQRSDRMAGFYRTQYEEGLLFFDSLIRFDQPVTAIVNADWAFANSHQSNIYRWKLNGSQPPKMASGSLPLPPVNIHYRDAERVINVGNYEYKHQPLGLVRLADANRGGFLTLGPTLSATSTLNRTSPIRRGVWVMERILGEHFEAPADVPDLEATQKKVASQNLSHAEILKLHSSQDGCSACHKYIDPVGFSLEMFDQLGIERTITMAAPDGEQVDWTPEITPKMYADYSWELTEPLRPGEETRVYFQYKKGRHRLNVRNVRLRSGKTLVTDSHFGFTGNAAKENVWFFPIPKDADADGWILTAEIQGDGGTDSSGVVTIASGRASDDGEGLFSLPNGRRFDTPAELKKALLEDYSDAILDNVIHRVLGYALGRPVRPIDRPAVDKIREELRDRGNRMTALLEAVAVSYPFRYRQSPDTDLGAAP